jgi:hypothetical protein
VVLVAVAEVLIFGQEMLWLELLILAVVAVVAVATMEVRLVRQTVVQVL